MASVHNNMYEREGENLHMSGDARIGKRQTDSNRTSHYFTNEIDATSNPRLIIRVLSQREEILGTIEHEHLKSGGGILKPLIATQVHSCEQGFSEGIYVITTGSPCVWPPSRSPAYSPDPSPELRASARTAVSNE